MFTLVIDVQTQTQPLSEDVGLFPASTLTVPNPSFTDMQKTAQTMGGEELRRSLLLTYY